MSSQISALIQFIRQYDGINDKAKLTKLVEGYLRIRKDDRRIELVPDVSKATFYDSEDSAYEDMLYNKKAFYNNHDTFYKIECVVVVFGRV